MIFACSFSPWYRAETQKTTRTTCILNFGPGRPHHVLKPSLYFSTWILAIFSDLQYYYTFMGARIDARKQLRCASNQGATRFKHKNSKFN